MTPTEFMSLRPGDLLVMRDRTTWKSKQLRMVLRKFKKPSPNGRYSSWYLELVFAGTGIRYISNSNPWHAFVVVALGETESQSGSDRH